MASFRVQLYGVGVGAGALTSTLQKGSAPIPYVALCYLKLLEDKVVHVLNCLPCPPALQCPHKKINGNLCFLVLMK